MSVGIRAKTNSDAAAIATLAERFWGSDTVVNSAGRYRVAALDGLVAVADDAVVGVVAYAIEVGNLHLVALASGRSGRGIGTALLNAVEGEARGRGLSRAWLITTNDNLNALGFYQRRGYRLAALRVGAVDAARAIKPSIPLIGERGIPLRDELVLEKPL